MCRSVLVLQDAMKRCPNGMFAEIKYDGERIQIHKNGSSFQVRVVAAGLGSTPRGSTRGVVP